MKLDKETKLKLKQQMKEQYAIFRFVNILLGKDEEQIKKEFMEFYEESTKEFIEIYKKECMMKN